MVVSLVNNCGENDLGLIMGRTCGKLIDVGLVVWDGVGVRIS